MISNYTTGHFSERNENLCSHKNLYTNVHKALFVTAPIYWMSFKRRMVKPTVVHPHHRIILRNKEQTIDTSHNSDESSVNYAK